MDDVGDGITKHLTDGYSVVDSWISGSYTSNLGILPLIVVVVEQKESWRDPPIWSQITLDRDHLSGEGYTVHDISKANKHWLSYAWIEKSTSLTEPTRGWTNF